MGIPDEYDELYDQIPQKAVLTRSFSTDIPSTFSLKRYAPYPKSQGQFGTCTGWAVAYTARTIVEAQKNNWTDRSKITENAFSPTFQFRLVKKNDGSGRPCWGAQTSGVVRSLYFEGSVPMNDFYVNSGTDLCPDTPLHSSNMSIAEVNRVEDYATLFSQNAPAEVRISSVKTSIAKGNPVAISMITPKSFHRMASDGLWRPTESPYASVDGLAHGRHAMCVVGYDDDKYGGAFEVQNSWGVKWGNAGYSWIRYEDFGRFVYQGYEIVKFEPPQPKEPLLAGSLRLFNEDDNQDMAVRLATGSSNWNTTGGSGQYTYKVNRDLPSGTEMRMYITSEQSAYVYMLGTGEVDKSVAQLFPVDGISPALSYLGSEVALPSEDHYFKMDNTTGLNYIILLFSKEKLDMQRIISRFAGDNESVSSRLRRATQEILVDSDFVDFTNDEIAFKIEQNETGKSAFAMIIQFNQVD